MNLRVVSWSSGRKEGIVEQSSDSGRFFFIHFTLMEKTWIHFPQLVFTHLLTVSGWNTKLFLMWRGHTRRATLNIIRVHGHADISIHQPILFGGFEWGTDGEWESLELGIPKRLSVNFPKRETWERKNWYYTLIPIRSPGSTTSTIQPISPSR